MVKSKLLFYTVLLCSFLVIFTACSSTSSSPTGNTVQITLTVSAAASLTNAVEEIKTLYGSENPDTDIICTFASSGTLQHQIEQGAPVDVFISASASKMDALREKGLIFEETKKDILKNRIVLITSKDSSIVTGFDSLSDEKIKVLALGEPKSVPAGQYADEVLTALGIKEKLQSKAIYGKDVREVLTWVETGNADAGIVYETDAFISDKVKIIEAAPEETHKPVVYPAAVVKSSKNQDAANEFLAFLSSEKAKDVFEKYGFHTGE